MRAFGAVPFSETTFSSIARTVFAVLGLTTTVSSGVAPGVTVPSGAVMDSIRLGVTRLPSLAMVAYTLAT